MVKINQIPEHMIDYKSYVINCKTWAKKGTEYIELKEGTILSARPSTNPNFYMVYINDGIYEGIYGVNERYISTIKEYRKYKLILLRERSKNAQAV